MGMVVYLHIEMHLRGVALCVVVLLAGSDASLPGAPTLDTHPGNKAEQMANELVQKAYRTHARTANVTDNLKVSTGKIRTVDSASQALDSVIKSREATVKKGKTDAMREVAEHGQKSDAKEADEKQKFDTQMTALQGQRLKFEAIAQETQEVKMPGVPPEKAKFSNATDEIKTSSDAQRNNTDILATADANIRVMHAKERKFKHLTDMSAARHKENMEKYCQNVYGKAANCKHQHSKDSAWQKGERQFKKANKRHKITDAGTWSVVKTPLGSKYSQPFDLE